MFGVPAGVDTVPASAPPGSFETSEWMRFNKDKEFQQWVMFKVGSVMQMVEQGFVDKDRPVVVVDCGSGIVVQILATRGVEAIGIEREPGHVKMAGEFANQHASRSSYPGKAPRFIHQTTLRELPLADGEAGLVCVFDRMEAHDNPVSLLHEARRVSGDDGAVLAISKCPPLTHEQPMHPYRPPMPMQMASLIKAATGWRTMLEVQPKTPGVPMVVLATDREVPTPQVQPSKNQAPMTLQPVTTG